MTLQPKNRKPSCDIATRGVHSLHLAIYNLAEAGRAKSREWNENCFNWAYKRRQEADEIAASCESCRTCPHHTPP